MLGVIDRTKVMIMENDRIKQWHPFLYTFESYDGKHCAFTFTCPTCGGHNCEKLGNIDKDCFWSGYYRCTDCGETKENGNPINYYSDAFLRHEYSEPIELNLF